MIMGVYEYLLLNICVESYSTNDLTTRCYLSIRLFNITWLLILLLLLLLLTEQQKALVKAKFIIIIASNTRDINLKHTTNMEKQ
jgi:hypothetical protein